MAHRAHASVEGIAHRLPTYAGRTMQDELEALTKVLQNPIRPLAAIVGGAKVSTKLDLLGSLLAKVDTPIIGGGMANTLLAARGYSVGKSLCERDLLPTAREIMAKAKAKGRELVLPVDAVVAKTFAPNAPSRVIAVVEVAEAAAELTAAGKIVTVAGGGDTVAALNAAGATERFTYVSTAGGAFLEWLEGKPLPWGRGAQGQITVAFLPSAHGGWSATKKGAPENQQQCGVDSPRTSRKTIRSFKSRCMAA